MKMQLGEAVREAMLYEAPDSGKMIASLINTDWASDNSAQMKAVQLLKGLAVSEDPASNKFMKAIDKFTSGLDAKSFS